MKSLLFLPPQLEGKFIEEMSNTEGDKHDGLSSSGEREASEKK